jgi:hypothetical protein
MRSCLAAIGTFIVLAVGLLLVGRSLLPVACGCTAPPTPPPEVQAWSHSYGDAEAVVGRVSGASFSEWQRWGIVDGERLWIVQDAGGSATTTLAYVDGEDGHLAAFLGVDELPTEPAVATDAAAAEWSAARFLSRAGVAIDGLTLSTSTVALPGQGMRAWSFTWGGSSDGRTVTVDVNASTGAVFWLSDRRASGPAFTSPMGGKAEAEAAALAINPTGVKPNFSSFSYASLTAASPWAWWDETFNPGEFEVYVDAFTGIARLAP